MVKKRRPQPPDQGQGLPSHGGHQINQDLNLGVTVILYKGLSRLGNTFAYIHQIAGVVPFSCIAAVALSCTKTTFSKLPTAKGPWFPLANKTLGVLMIAAPPLTAIVMTRFLGTFLLRRLAFECSQRFGR